MALFLSCQISNAQLVVYSGYNLQGTSANCVIDTIYINNNIPNGLNNSIKSISLNQGFMATLAENEDGTGERFTYMANKSNVNVNLAMVLQNKVSFIRVIKLPSIVIKKKGSANTDNSYTEDLNATWFYDWGLNDNSTPTREFVPVAWGASGASDANINAVIAKDSLTHFNAFNEPDNSGQSNLFVSAAIPLYKKLLRAGQRMGSPACTESQYRVWLDSFTTVANRDSLRIDYVCDHWYDWGNWLSTGNANPSAVDVFNRFKTYVNNLYDYYKKPIWITEFNANVNRSPAVHEAFLQLALPWLDANPNVERYAYFFGNDYPMYSSPGVLSTGGSYYANYASVNAYPENIIDTRPSFPNTLAAWDPSTILEGGRSVSTFAPTTLETNMQAPLPITRGSGLSLPATGSSNGYWGATGWSTTTAATGITGNNFLTFSLKSTNSKSVNYNAIDKFNIRINNIGPIQYQIDYKIDNGTYRPCATVAGPTRTTGNYALGPINLSNISGLQNVSASNTVTFRITPFDASSSTGAFLIGSGTADTNPDLSITGGYSDENTITPQATNADLSALTLSSGVLSPSFSSAIASYTASVSSSLGSITVTPTKANVNASIDVRVNNGTYVSVNSGSASGALNLNVGNNTIEVRVTAQDGTTIKVYTVTVVRPSTNADLSALTISSGTLSPVFASATTSYTATVSSSTTSITVTPTRANDNAKIEVSINSGSYVEVSSASASNTLNLNAGSNPINIRVTAQDGTTTKTYTVSVTRPSTNADLASLTVSSGILTPSFAAATTTYVDTVANGIASITVTPTKADANATIQVRVNSGTYTTVNSGSASGALSLANISPTNNTVNVRVTAQDGVTVKTYTITVTRLSANANLTALLLSSGTLSPTFSQNTITYTASVPNTTSAITITPTSASTIATIQVRVNGGSYIAVNRGEVSGSLNLNTGNNTVEVLVTAQDGTAKTYTITVNRALNTWLGSSSTDFSNAANWSGNAVPTAVDNVVVASGINNPLITGIQSVNNITINTGATLNVTGTLKVAGTITNNGTINATAGTVEYNGTSAQTIAANTFANNLVQNLTINNTAGVTLAGLLTVTGTLTPTSGVLTTGANLTIASSALNTANIAAGTGTYISGAVNVQRYTRAQRGFRILGHPFNTAQNLGILTDNFRITGLTTNAGSGIYASSSGNPSAFVYDATQTAGTTDVLAKITDATANTWDVGKGIYVFVRGNGNEGMNGAGASNYVSGHNPLVIDGTGNINQGSVTVNLTYGGVGKDNYNLIGNPYPCPINLKNVTGINSFGTVYVYNPIKNLAGADQYNVAGGFDQYTNNGTNNIIVPVFGAFFIKATANGQSITFNETDKIANGSPTYTVFGVEKKPKLLLEVANVNGKLDEVVIGLDNSSSDGSTDKYDAAKLDNSLLNFYSFSSDNKALAIDYRASLNNSIPLGLQTDLINRYTITLGELTDLPNTQLVLRDKLLKTETILSRVGDSYSFDVTADTATKGNNRFEIGLLGTTVLPVQIADITAQLQNNKIVAVSWISRLEVNLVSYKTYNAVTMVAILVQ